MYKYKIVVAYDGTKFGGWQIQPNTLTIQECLEKALKVFLKEHIRIVGAGRTDAGVHAVGQVAHFISPTLLDERKALYAINGLLPFEIRVKELKMAHDAFHARFSSIGKEYHYHISTERQLDPFSRLYRHHFPFPCHLDLLRETASIFVGKKDFKTFANMGSSAKTTIRTIRRIDILEEVGGFRMEFEGDGFLYKMVRNLVGTLLDVALGKKTSEDVIKMLEQGDRKKAGMAAPSKGLFLVRVDYPSFLS